MTNVLIVEDDPMARRLLEIFLEGSAEYRLANSIENAAIAKLYCEKNPIDLILMDVCTAMNENGLDAAEYIKKHFPRIKIIIITSQPECSFIDRARDIGVDSFWYKNAEVTSLLSCMDSTMNGKSVYPDATPTVQIGNICSAEFTDRELEVLRELAGGQTDAAIAEKLHMSLRTVKTHIQNMRDKTGFHNRTELAIRARESGLVIHYPEG